MEYDDKFLMKAWDHENNVQVETVGTYKGECDHPDMGTVVFVEYENKDCHLDSLFSGKKEDEEMSVNSFYGRIISKVAA